jgi:ankyrin repeat protein
LKGLIGKELDDICKAAPSLAKSIYTKFEEGFSKWWEEGGDVVWLSKNAQLWQDVVTHLIAEISDPELTKFVPCGIRFSEQQIQRLCDAIKHNTFLNIVTNCDIRYLLHLKTYQALNKLGYTNSLFIGLKSLKELPKEILKLCHSKRSAALVIDCDCDGNVADILLGILQNSVACEQSLGSSDGNVVETLVEVLKRYERKVIIISTRQQIKLASSVQGELGNINGAYEDNCVVSDLDAESQRQILERTVSFQGTDVTLDTLVGADRLECIKPLVDSEVISILLSDEHKLCVGRQLSDLPTYFVPRVLQHHVYLKEDVLQQTQNAVKFAVSGLQAAELRSYLPVAEKICEFVYDDRERSHSFKIVSDLYTIGFSTELDSMMANNNIIGEETTECDISESRKDNASTISDNFPKFGLSAGQESDKAYKEVREKMKSWDVRYIVLGNDNPERKFGELKSLFANVHWIHVEEGSFLWRDSNCDIDIIRKYIDETKCRNLGIENLMEQSDRTMLLVAEPGMGKSTFLSHMEHEIKNRNKAVWVLRINLSEHTSSFQNLEFEEEYIEKCKMFLWKAAGSSTQCAEKFVKQIFLQALEQKGKMVILLDGFDEISPHYTPKVYTLIRAMRDATSSQIFVSSRLSSRQNLEDVLIKLPFKLQPFDRENQIQFLERYWNKYNKVMKEEYFRKFAKKFLRLCLQNFSDKDGEFTRIPLQIMMLGEAYVKEANEYYSDGELNLPEKFDILQLFNKFWEKKCYIYFREKNEMDQSKLNVMEEKELLFRNHVNAALISLFSLQVSGGLLGAVSDRDWQQAKVFLESDVVETFGMIREVTDGKPHFIHRCFAEYFAAKWFTDNFTTCKDFVSDTLFNSTYEVTRTIFDQMLAKDDKIHRAVLNNDIAAVDELLKNGTDINKTDKGGRTALHLAASYNSPAIQKLLSCQVIKTNIADKVQNWTPLRYADRTKSWKAMDTLLQNGANADDIVLSRPKSGTQECVKEALWECASKGYTGLLEFMLDCGIEVNAVVEVPENIQGKNTLLHIASTYCQLKVMRLLMERTADINIRNAKHDSALHLAALSGSVEIIEMLLDNGVSVDLVNEENDTPLHVSALSGNLEATKTLVEKGAPLNNVNKNGFTPLLWAANKGREEVFRYLTEMGADINVPDAKKNTVLYHAAVSGSVEIIKIVLDKGMCADLKNVHHSTALHFSAFKGNLEVTIALVERGASLNTTTNDGVTSLHLAANNGKLEVFRYLTEMGADINITDNDRNTVLHHSAKSGNVEIIKIILDRGMSVNPTNANDYTPLHFSAIKNNLEPTKTLVERGASLTNASKYVTTPLLLAAKWGNLEVFRYLTEVGADIHARDANGYTTLHYAAVSDSVEIIKILLHKRMSVNLTSACDFTPLHLSAQYGNLEATKILVQSGAAINSTNKFGKTPVNLAAYKVKVEVVRYLTDICADINIPDDYRNTVLHYVAISGSVQIIKILLDKGMSVKLTNAYDLTPLHLSAQYGNLEATKILVQSGAGINNTDTFSKTPMKLAATNDKLEVFRYLTEIGGDINITDDYRNTVLHHAAISGSVEIIKILLDKGMSVNLTNALHFTPLHLSAQHGNLEATKILVQSGAAINSTNKFGKTPLKLAASNGKVEVVRYLEGMGGGINRDSRCCILL